jgi:hypothetical protein
VHTTREPRSDVPATNGDHAPVYAGRALGSDVDDRQTAPAGRTPPCAVVLLNDHAISHSTATFAGEGASVLYVWFGGSGVEMVRWNILRI